MTLPDIYVPAGSSGHGNFTVDIDPQRAGWTFSGLRVLVLEAGASEVVETGEAELLVLPLAGGATVEDETVTPEADLLAVAVARATELIGAGEQDAIKTALETAGARRVGLLKGDQIQAFLDALPEA